MARGLRGGRRLEGDRALGLLRSMLRFAYATLLSLSISLSLSLFIHLSIPISIYLSLTHHANMYYAHMLHPPTVIRW